MPPLGMDADPPPDQLFSPAALHRAWRLVRRSGPSAGTDRVTPQEFERNLEDELKRLRHDILSGQYHPNAVNRFYLPKPNGKRRPITIWAVRDRVAQRVIHDYLTPILEAIFLDCSYGFRPGRSTSDAVNAVIRARDAHLRWVVDADITACFDSIPPELLLPQVRSLVASGLAVHLIEQWLTTPVYKYPRLHAGVSQGGVISPQLANLYLHRFDQMILAALPEAALVRFADDFVILCRRKREAWWGLSVARRSLGNLKLHMNMDKTRVVHVDEGFSFLGATFKGNWNSALPGSRNPQE
ncbi:reverse transcriptase domain-containing protein [Aggregatilinea lenta]|uniref:reverse transcriptase domain-containing protein n=1 Tax=Aggregatilinea lenta TaxID=913108 RepID=UPI000E5BE551|nr:reverse transcriptase domain-containing protein [Aggregatilinea lenta]